MPLTVFLRSVWDARAAKRAYNLPVYPVTHIYIHNGATHAPLDLRDADGDGIPDIEESIWRGYQRFHMDTRDWTDIAYNFGVGKSGAVLEGRGWRRQGGATGYPDDRRSLSICAIGNFDVSPVTEEMVTAIIQWIITGIELGHIVKNPVILGHKDKPYATSCPGRFLYAQLPRIRSEVADGRVSSEVLVEGPVSEWYTEIAEAPDGTRNEAIRLWQFLLYEQEVLTLDDVDGVKGPQTRAAHKQFEVDRGASNPNGRPGQFSWGWLLAGPTPEVVEVEVTPDLTALTALSQDAISAIEDVQDEVDRLNG